MCSSLILLGRAVGERSSLIATGYPRPPLAFADSTPGLEKGYLIWPGKCGPRLSIWLLHLCQKLIDQIHVDLFLNCSISLTCFIFKFLYLSIFVCFYANTILSQLPQPFNFFIYFIVVLAIWKCKFNEFKN